MKIALIVVGVLVVLTGGILAIGAILPKHHVASRSATFHATPDKLFALISGPQDWRSDVAKSEIIPNNNGRDLLRETTRDGNTLDYLVVERVPPTLLKRQTATRNLPYSGSWTYSQQPQGDQTVVRITEDADIYNPLFRFVSRFILGYTGSIDVYLRALGHATGQEVEITD